jgi:hypothetical protein
MEEVLALLSEREGGVSLRVREKEIPFVEFEIPVEGPWK